LPLLVCTGCLTQAGKRVQLVKADAPADCREVGVVTGEHGDPESQQAEMRNTAAKLGANYVRWEADTPAGSRGTAYACPK
jgi:hypothetical protein